MPELPEVETIVGEMIDCRLLGSQVLGIDSDWPKMISPISLEEARLQLIGKRISAIGRRGKYIVLTLGDLTVLMHLRMSGRIFIAGAAEPRSPYVHFSILLDDEREIRFHDTRKFGTVRVTSEPEFFLGKLGVEPLGEGFSLHYLREAFANRNRMIKPLLLDQGIIAGLGNIYVDEALWHAGIHPQSQSETLTATQLRALRFAIPKVLRSGIRNGGTSLGNGYGNYTSVTGRAGTNKASLKVYGRSGLPCPKCGETICKIIVAQRGTHICPSCQPSTQRDSES